MSPREFTVVRDAHGDLMLVCPKGHRIDVASHASLSLLTRLAADHLREEHGQ